MEIGQSHGSRIHWVADRLDPVRLLIPHPLRLCETSSKMRLHLHLHSKLSKRTWHIRHWTCSGVFLSPRLGIPSGDNSSVLAQTSIDRIRMLLPSQACDGNYAWHRIGLGDLMRTSSSCAPIHCILNPNNADATTLHSLGPGLWISHRPGTFCVSSTVSARYFVGLVRKGEG